MANKIDCILVINTRNGYCMTPERHSSLREAVKSAKNSWGFAYRIFDLNKKLIKHGFCD